MLNSVPEVPIIEASFISPNPIKNTGRTKPLAIQCNSMGPGIIRDYVVKLYGSCELGCHSLAREVYGGLLAHVFKFDTPEIAIVNISSELIQAVNDPVVRDKLRTSPGLNFGSKTVTTPIQFDGYIPDILFPQAVEIYAFDMLLRNPDRRVGKPNMFQCSESFILYDHEMAFPYSKPIMFLGFVPDPWSLRPEDFARNHIMYQHIRQKATPDMFDSFLEKLLSLSDEILDTILERIPLDWRTSDLDFIAPYINKARSNIDQFKRGLQEALA